ncbi:MAG: DUF309 domain-containing protein [Planctomycetaceae bacterium]|nr:DUF309 domain-containing protein [Planctomycetaceae bacterium]
MTVMTDPRFSEAIELFNAQEFFACHDVLEELWSETLDESREFYQGLIHAAVALFHFSEGNLGGARKMHDSAVRYLAPYGDTCRGLELRRFRVEFDHCFEELLQVSSGYPQGVAIDPQRIPLLIFHPSRS